MRNSLYLLLSLLPSLVSAQSSQPASAPSTAPSSQPQSQPSSQASQPASEPKEEESLEPTPEELAPALPLLPPVPLVLRGLSAPVKNIRVGLHADHIVFRGLPGQGSEDLTSFETVTASLTKRIASGLTLEARFPISHEATTTFDNQGNIEEESQNSAFGNVSLGVTQAVGGKRLRKVFSLELALPTAGRSPEDIATGALSSIGARYELPLFLPGASSVRARGAVGSTYRRVGYMAELGVDSLFATGDLAALLAPFELNVRGGFSLSYQATTYFSVIAEYTISKSLTGGEDGEGDEADLFDGNLDDASALHLGMRVFLGRVVLGGFLTLPAATDNPLAELTNIGLGVDLAGALF